MLKLRFEKPDARSSQGNAWIVPDQYSCDSNGWPELTPHCASLDELECHIDRMKAELEENRARGRRAFEKASSVRSDLSDIFP
jgi:hypothetical protein